MTKAPLEDVMIAVTNEPPAYCPCCGRPTKLDFDLLLNAEYRSIGSYTCQACGTLLQLADD